MEQHYYHMIPGLLVPRKAPYKQMHDNINEYIDSIQQFTEDLELSFLNIATQQADFEDHMESFLPLLNNVYARALEADADEILHSVRHDEAMSDARKLVKPFISKALSLSIEMQRAQKQDDTEGGESIVSEVESCADIASNLSAVGNLIHSGHYDKAHSMITELEEASPETMLFKLLDLVTSKQYDEAEHLANTMKNKHVEALNQLSGVDMSKKILAVDDMPEVLAAVKGALKSHYKVFGVTSGATALKFLDAQIPDIFILDIDMPDMDGFELAGLIRAMPDHAKTPILFLTGNSSRERIIRAMEVGGNDFIVKPASHEMLLTKAGKYLNKGEIVDQYHRMLEQYTRDELTGLYGNKKFRDFINGIEARTASVGVIFFDVNGLKHYNDTMRHHAGDLLLQKAATSIDTVPMENVYAFRTGGDEFVAVMPDCAEGDLSVFFEKWRVCLDSLNAEEDDIHCAVAAGGAFGTGDYRISELLKLADERMYETKRKMKEDKTESAPACAWLI